MATSAESAQDWLNSKKPSTEEIKSVLSKLEARIEAWEGDEDQIQGSIDAALILETALEEKPQPDMESTHLTIDTTALIPDSEPVELEKAIKDKTFAALKAQLGKTLD